MTFSDVFWPTFWATGVVTLPSVYLAFYIGRRVARRDERALVVRGWRRIGEAGSAIYDVRDWSDSLCSEVVAGQTLRLSTQVASAACLYAMVDAGQVPDRAMSTVLELARRVERLRIITDDAVGTILPPTMVHDVVREATLIGRLARHLVETSAENAD